MTAKKEIRGDNTYIISKESTDNPKLGAKILADGRDSLFLDFYLGFEMAISAKSGKKYKKVNNTREYFHNKSWTISYSPKVEQFISFYTFKPNTYISHETYFQTVFNNPIKINNHLQNIQSLS